MRKLLLGLVLAGLATVAPAADKRITLSGGNTLVLNNWGANWVVGTPLPDWAEGTVTFHGPDAQLWRVILAPLPPHPTLTGDTGNLRIYVRNMSRGMENGGVNVDHEQKPIEGANARGFYVKARDTRKKTKAQIARGEDYTDGYTGALSINGRPYLFEVVWNTGGESIAASALSSLKTARIQ